MQNYFKKRTTELKEQIDKSDRLEQRLIYLPLAVRTYSASVNFILICVWMTWTDLFAQSLLRHPCLQFIFGAYKC